ncbi:uncharacterized protein LOC130449434 [Diorhabda sublineata]|uniref:uncharacterized protein LOC130449434 n=1 Tax=Diorhabda sublineata TaxID=1163346 RepID=UPI0024E081E6|nr:uncharacterized protein LOC130449434 [Diorhabda sublineata]
MLLLAIFFILCPLELYSFELCNENENLKCGKSTDNVTDNCKIHVNNNTEDCRLYDFSGGDNVKLNFGDVFLHLMPETSQNILSMNVFPTLRWTKTLVKFSEYNKQKSCNIYIVEKFSSSLETLRYNCYWKEKAGDKILDSILIEINSETDGQLAHKKILFNIPDTLYFKNSVPLPKRKIFSYIDFTNSNRIILKIQPLDPIYEITHYKVEVFREKEKQIIMLDVRLIAAHQKSFIDFEYTTYSEEGYYYFAVSVIGKHCPEDFCFRTLTPKVHIARKGRPLVIGIVGASFLIPFVLFSFYLWNHKYRNHSGLIVEPIKKVVVLFKPSFEKHNDVVSGIITAIEQFSEPEVIVERINLSKVQEKSVEKFCSDNLILATHIVYVNPPFVDDDAPGLDYMTFNFLKEETKKKTSDKKLIVVRLSYSKKDVPSILSPAIHFDLLQDLFGFINIFNTVEIHSDYTKHPVYVELAKKIEEAAREARFLRNVPEIVVTDECEEPTEIDGLI